MRLKLSRELLLIILSAGIFLSVIDLFIVNVAIPSIKKGIHGTDADMQLVIALYLLGYAVFLLAGGRVGDVYGKKNAYVTGMVFFTIASGFCGFAHTAWQLNLGRLFQGISAAFMVPQGIAYIQVLFNDPKARTRAFGIYGSIAGTASVIGQLLGGILPDITLIDESWRLVFLINFPIGLISAVFAAKFLPDHKVVQPARFDFSGAALLTVSLTCLVLPVILGRELNWPLWSVMLIIFSLILLAVFIYIQKRKQTAGKQPLIDFHLFAFKDFRIGLYASVCYFLVQDTYFLINTVLMQTGFGISSSVTGLFFVVQGLGYMFASFTTVRYVGRYGKNVLIVGIIAMVVSLAFHIAFLHSPKINLFVLVPALFVYGAGCGTVLPSLLTLTLKNIPSEYAGAASGTYATFQQISIALGIGILGGMFYDLLGSQTDVQDFSRAYQVTSFINMLLLLVVGMFVFFLPKSHAPCLPSKHSFGLPRK
ncbi:MFS transporter [Dyadobacter fanqingshengii]|uniref:MFS transporter n=1 Tax=Dyadobacter fanqingshengii TaxID=2906443 RepID=A0A9X1PBM6_9BACT|nr:MFS transporter [Dyadobacter fanqingshengii]MCF0041996.1 MFS transporter [Dyadobacter fanqingshengii]USJ36300.1 MFS transporter [Dyadobacter fanqingshengii]